MQFFARLEAHCFAGSNADFCPGSRIAANSGFPGTDAENSEAAQLDTFPSGESLLQAFKYGVYGCLSLGARQARALDYVMYDVLLDHCRYLACAIGIDCTMPNAIDSTDFTLKMELPMTVSAKNWVQVVLGGGKGAMRPREFATSLSQVVTVPWVSVR